MTTLDAVIAEYGTPRFCKIDVEGFEREVIGGLSQPLPLLSFEFSGEFIDDVGACLQWLEQLAPIEAGAASGEIGERFGLELGWRSPGALVDALTARAALDAHVWGELYVRCPAMRARAGRVV